MKYARQIPFVLLLLALPNLALAAPRTFQELANVVAYLLDNATAVLIVAGLAVYFYGISINILKFGDEGMEKVRAYFFWGVIVLFLMVSIWGVLRLLQNTLFGGDQFYNFGGGGGSGSGAAADGGSFQSADLFTGGE